MTLSNCLDSLKAYFEKFGEVEKAEVKMESANRSRYWFLYIYVYNNIYRLGVLNPRKNILICIPLTD